MKAKKRRRRRLLGRVIQHSTYPVTPNARFIVKCSACGYAHDSDATTETAACEDIAARHLCVGNAFTARRVDYTAHPLHRDHEDLMP